MPDGTPIELRVRQVCTMQITMNNRFDMECILIGYLSANRIGTV